MVSDTSFYIGNLRPEKVQSLMKEMLERGYCDLSGMEYQQAKMSPELVIDGGESPAYSSEITLGSFPSDLRSCGFGMERFGGMDGFDCETDDDDEFSYEEDEED